MILRKTYRIHRRSDVALLLGFRQIFDHLLGTDFEIFIILKRFTAAVCEEYDVVRVSILSALDERLDAFKAGPETGAAPRKVFVDLVEVFILLTCAHLANDIACIEDHVDSIEWLLIHVTVVIEDVARDVKDTRL